MGGRQGEVLPDAHYDAKDHPAQRREGREGQAEAG
jgi:hypothetical protein